MKELQVTQVKKELFEHLKLQRLQLSALLQVIDKIKSLPDCPPYYKRELSLSYTSIQLGRMYIGELLFSLGDKYPYTNTNQATKPSEIEPEADKYHGEVNPNSNIITTLTSKRQFIDQILQMFNTDIFHHIDKPASNTYSIAVDRHHAKLNFNKAYSNLKEGRMWMGVALGIIRDHYNGE